MNFKLALTLMTLTPSLLLAQTSTTDLSAPETSSDNARYEKMEVTGSYIKRVDLEGAQPVQTLDKDYLEKTGYNSVGDVLRDLTANSFGSDREASGSSVAGVATVSLRGLGADRTLVLMNGRRLAKDGIAASVDLNLIPMAAIERMDVLKVGGSATYGSDAVGGVINIITKKNYVGSELNMRQEVTELGGGNRTTINGVFGTSSNKGSVMTSLQFRKNGSIKDSERSWSANGISTRSPVPNIDTGSGPVAASGCPQFDPATGQCAFNYWEYSTSLPEIQQFNTLTNASYNINALTKVDAQVSATRKDTTWNYAPGAVRLTNFAAPRDITLSNGNTITAGTNIEELLWRSLPLGTRDNEVQTDSYAVSTGLTRYIGDTWEANLNVSHENIKRTSTAINGYAKRDALTAAILDGSCDPFTGGGAGCATDAIRYESFSVTESRLDTLELRTNGELLDLPSGPLSMAIGGQMTYETYGVNIDAESAAGNVAGGGAGSEGGGTRRVTAFFAELAAPITDKIEAQLSGRYDSYSDFGSTLNPQINIMYKPVSSVLLRASAGTGFKAPNMQDLYQTQSFGSPTFIDEKGCADGVPGACAPAQYTVATNGNVGLREEKSTTYNIGAVIQANRQFSASVDFYNIELENTVGIGYRGLTEAENSGVNLSQYNTSVTRRGDGSISLIETQLQNLSNTRVQGLDLNLKFNTTPQSWGEITFNNNTSYLTKYDQQGFPGTPFRSVFERSGAPRWRNNLNVDYGPTEKLLLSTSFRTVGPSKKFVETEGDLSTYTQIDTRVSYNLAFLKARVSVGAVNILGTTPPLDETSNSDQLNASVYDNIGRRFFAAYTQSF